MPENNVSSGQSLQGALLRFYVHQDHRQRGRRVWEWLLEQGNKLGINGGSAFQVMAGFGRHHVLHGAKSLELADASTVEVQFIVSHEDARRLLDALITTNIRLSYSYAAAIFGVVNTDTIDPPSIPPMKQSSDPFNQ